MQLENRGHLLLRILVPVPFRTCAFVLMLTPVSLELVVFLDIEFQTSLGTFILPLNTGISIRGCILSCITLC